MAFIREKTIKGKRYRYLQENKRVGKKVKSKMTYLGAVGSIAAVTVLAARDMAGKEKPRHYKTGRASTDERANRHQVDYERELFINDREKWHAHMRHKLNQDGQRKAVDKQSKLDRLSRAEKRGRLAEEAEAHRKFEADVKAAKEFGERFSKGDAPKSAPKDGDKPT